MLCSSSIAASSSMRTGVGDGSGVEDGSLLAFSSFDAPLSSPPVFEAEFEVRSCIASMTSAPGPITVMEVKRSILASASLRRLFCKPSPKLTIVTIAATPTMTPMTVNEVLSLACRRLRHASAMMSANFIRSTRNYLAVFKPDDARRESVRQFPIMRHQDDGFAVPQPHFVQHAQHFGGAAAVQIAGGFVRQRDLRFVGYGARDADALLLAARKL